MLNDTIIFLLAGFIGGAVNGAAGGAKLFVFPMLLASGLPPIAANVTQGIALWPAQLPAVWVYRKELLQDLRALMFQMVPALIGALLGALVMINSDEKSFVSVIPFLLAIAVIAILLGPKSAVLMRSAFPGNKLKFATAVFLFAIGFYGGYFGAGMGFMLLAVLSASLNSGLGSVNGAKNLMAFGIQTVAVIPMALSGLVDWNAAALVLIGGIAGGYIGANITRAMPEKYIRWSVAALGVFLTLSFLLR